MYFKYTLEQFLETHCFILTKLIPPDAGLYPPATKSHSLSMIATHAWRLKKYFNTFDNFYA